MQIRSQHANCLQQNQHIEIGWGGASVTMLSKANLPCPSRLSSHRHHHLFSRLFQRLCLLLVHCAAWPCKTNNLTPCSCCHQELSALQVLLSRKHRHCLCPLLPVHDGGVQEAEWATLLAREGRLMAPHFPGGQRVRWAAVLPNASRRVQQPTARINPSRTLNWSMTVHAGASCNSSRLHSSRK